MLEALLDVAETHTEVGFVRLECTASQIEEHSMLIALRVSDTGHPLDYTLGHTEGLRFSLRLSLRFKLRFRSHAGIPL